MMRPLDNPRWLVLYALAVALLAGQGFQTLGQQDFRLIPGKGRQSGAPLARPLFVGLVGLLGLMIWSLLAVWLARYSPVGPESPAETGVAVDWTDAI